MAEQFVLLLTIVHKSKARLRLLTSATCRYWHAAIINQDAH